MINYEGSEARSEGAVFAVDHGMRDYAQIDRVFGRSISNNLSFLRLVYGLEISAVDTDLSDPSDLGSYGLYQGHMWAYLQVLRQEVGIYPPNFIRKYLNKVRITRGLTMPHPKHPDSDSLRIKLYGRVYPHATYLNPDFRNESATRETVHHETEHCVTLGEKWLENEEDLERWTQYNILGNEAYIEDRYWDLTPEEKSKLDTTGFMSPYGRKTQLEDRATIAQKLMTNPVYTHQRASTDHGLSKKVNHLKENYYVWSDGLIDGQFYEDLADGKVDENYWNGNRWRKIFASCWTEAVYWSGSYQNTFIADYSQGLYK